MSGRYATTAERLAGHGWCVLCGRWLDVMGGPGICADECLPATGKLVGLEIRRRDRIAGAFHRWGRATARGLGLR